jgi:hypothetical protein
MKKVLGLCLVIIAAVAVFSHGISASTDSTVQFIQQDARDALTKGEFAVGEKLLANDYSAVRVDRPDTKWLQMAGDSSMLYRSFDTSHVLVFVYDQTAVASGLVGVTGKQDGKDVNATYRYSRTYSNRNGKWEPVFTQFTRLVTKVQEP